MVLEDGIRALLRRYGLPEQAAVVDPLARHAGAVLDAPRHLHLTAIRERGEFLERHVGESLQGAALLDPDARGVLVDLGSGNGYPGLAMVCVHQGLSPLLCEASERKALFLDALARAWLPDARVWTRPVQRPGDLPAGLSVRALVTRAMGNWERIVPRLVPILEPDADVLIWAGESMQGILRREVWRRLELVGSHALKNREQSWIWHLRRVAG